jgi:hypothetical protein
MNPQPMGKLDVSAMAAMNGPADDPPLTGRIGGRLANRQGGRA